MQEERETALPEDVLGLAYGEHLFVWTLRRVVVRRTVCPVVVREFSEACGDHAGEVLATFRVFLEMLGYTARRRISIGHPGWFGLTGDERQLLSLIAAAQDHDQERVDALLCWIARIEVRDQLAIAVRALAVAFATHNLRVSSGVPPQPGRPIGPCSDSSHERTVLAAAFFAAAEAAPLPDRTPPVSSFLQGQIAMTSIATSDTAEAGRAGRGEPRRELLDTLLSRQSCGLLREPAPDETELAFILDAGLCAPDHGRLRPWRFVIIRTEARAAFAELLVAALKRREADPQEVMVERVRNRILGVPLLIAIGAKIKPDGPIPEIEQLLSAGAAAMNMLSAIHALGYGGMWVTGANAYDRSVNEALGFAWPDRLVGMLFVGTRQASSRLAARPARADHVREWIGIGIPCGSVEGAS